MAGLVPRLSGSAMGQLEEHLVGVPWWAEVRSVELIKRPPMHEVGADEPGEGERAFDDVLSRLSQSQQQEGDQRDGDLDADGVLGGAEEARDLEGLLDPAEEQLDGPAALVEVSNLFCGRVEIVAQDA